MLGELLAFARHYSTMSSQHAGQKRRRRSTNADRQDDSIARVHADFTNSGGGTQHNNLGAGNQNNNSGLGTQYNANSITFGMKPIPYVAPLPISTTWRCLHFFLHICLCLYARESDYGCPSCEEHNVASNSSNVYKNVSCPHSSCR